MKTTIQNSSTNKVNGATIAIVLFLILLVGSVTANVLINGIPNI